MEFDFVREAAFMEVEHRMRTMAAAEGGFTEDQVQSIVDDARDTFDIVWRPPFEVRTNGEIERFFLEYSRAISLEIQKRNHRIRELEQELRDLRGR